MSINTDKLNGGIGYAEPVFMPGEFAAIPAPESASVVRRVVPAGLYRESERENLRLKRALARSKNRINQLCGMVNNYSNQLGLGNKVHADDWTDIDTP